MKQFRVTFNRLWWRVLTVFICCLIPLLLTQMILRYWAADTVRQYIYDAASANTVYLRDSFLENIDAVATNAQYCINSKYPRELFVYRDSYHITEYYDKVQQIQLLLKNVQDSHAIVQEVRLHYPRFGMYITPRAVYNLPEEQIREKLAAFSSQETLLLDRQGTLSVCGVLGSMSRQADGSITLPALYIEVLLNPQRICRQLSAYNIGANVVSFQFLPQTGTLLLDHREDLQTAISTALSATLKSKKESAPSIERISIGPDRYLLAYSYSARIDSYFGQLVPLDELEYIPNAIQRSMVFFGMLSAIVLMLLSLFVYRQVSRPTKILLDAFDATGRGLFKTRIGEDANTFAHEFQQLSHHYDSMNEHIQALIHENYESVLRLQRAEIKQLQAQINPHFLYNSFFLLRSSIACGDLRQGDLICKNLGSYFRYISRNNADTALLEDEYRHALNYLSIQAMRFEDSLELNIQPLPESVQKLSVPRLIVQPLIENIMVHGEWEENDIRKISLSFEQTPGEVLLIVKDNGRNITDERLSEINRSLQENTAIDQSYGLKNTHLRIHLKNERGGLAVSRSDLGGFQVTLTLPKS